MIRTRHILALLAGGFGTATALFGAPTAVADPDGGGGPMCQAWEACFNPGGASVAGSPGNSEITARPNDLGEQAGVYADEFGEGSAIAGRD